ncbi:hypothetical protein [Amycolatopsis sp. NPDC051903]|uniref:hypothetical protein n=1 Tax=Amycolatopsis sp. NPDC051903 TaxID=3363936 RepID=UPI00379C5F29
MGLVVADGRVDVAETALLTYFFGTTLVLVGRAVATHWRVKPLLGTGFEKVDAGRKTVAGRRVAIRLNDGRWVRFTLRRYAAEPLAQCRFVWLLRGTDRALVLIPGLGFRPARIQDEGLAQDLPVTAPATEPDPRPRLVLARRNARLSVAWLTGLIALLLWARLSFPPGDRSLLGTAWGLLVFIAALLLFGALRMAFRRPVPIGPWTELELANEPTITHSRGRLSIAGHAVRPDGTQVTFLIPRCSLLAALDVAATRRLWTAGRRAGLPGHVWTGGIRFPAPDLLPEP